MWKVRLLSCYGSRAAILGCAGWFGAVWFQMVWRAQMVEIRQVAAPIAQGQRVLRRPQVAEIAAPERAQVRASASVPPDPHEPIAGPVRVAATPTVRAAA